LYIDFHFGSAACFGCIFQPTSGRNTGSQKRAIGERPLFTVGGYKIIVKFLVIILKTE
jgi:hypothetical protein